jgi:hypothetical protein
LDLRIKRGIRRVLAGPEKPSRAQASEDKPAGMRV